jgi:hypothetical protein
MSHLPVQHHPLLVVHLFRICKTMSAHAHIPHCHSPDPTRCPIPVSAFLSSIIWVTPEISALLTPVVERHLAELKAFPEIDVGLIFENRNKVCRGRLSLLAAILAKTIAKVTPEIWLVSAVEVY